MTVKELKQKIENLPDYMDVFIRQIDDNFPNSSLESAEVKQVEYSDGEVVLAIDDALILSDDC